MKHTTLKHTAPHSIFAVTCAIALTATAHAELIQQVTVAGKITDGVTTPSTSYAIVAGSTYNLKAITSDSNAPSPNPDSDSKSGLYNSAASAQTTAVTDTGTEFKAAAQAIIAWTATTWATKTPGLAGVPSYATVKPVASPAGKSESASAKATVVDPRTYQIALDPSGQPLFLNFFFSIGAGATVGTIIGPGYTGSASMSGSYQNSMLPGDMWSFSWSADSADPGSSSFTFFSNPALGLDDAAIQSAFNSLVSGSGGQFALTQDFTVSAQIAAPTLPGQSTFTFSMGGETDYNADASVASNAPEPNYSLMLGLILLGGSAIFRGRSRAARTWDREGKSQNGETSPLYKLGLLRENGKFPCFSLGTGR
jgi:hypothetical protein